MSRRQSAREIEQEAVHWVARLDREGRSGTLDRELSAWLQEDPRRQGALLQAEAAWSLLDGLADDGIEAEKAPHHQSAPAARRRTMVSRRAVLVAAGAGAIAASAAGLYVARPVSDLYETARGQVLEVPLEDRSTATLNTDSRLRVRFSGQRRSVRMDRGEAWFQVASDPDRPFLVSAGTARVEAVGTAFTVRRRESGADVMVSEGRVRVWSRGQETMAQMLVAGASAFVSETGRIVLGAAQAPAAIARRLSWRDGLVTLEGETLGEAVAEFNRYSAVPIVIGDPAVASERLYGVFRLDDPAGFARTAAVTLGASARISQDQIVIAAR